jgi:hypothetical protein
MATIIDRGVIEQAVDQTGVAFASEYGEEGSFAVEGNRREVIEFLMLVAQHDHALGVNLNDVMKNNLDLWWFPGFILEYRVDIEVSSSPDEINSYLDDPEELDPFRGSDI